MCFPFCRSTHCQAPEKRTTGLFLTQQQMAQCHYVPLQAENLKGNIAGGKTTKKQNRAQIAGSSAATYPRGKIKEVQHLFERQESYNYK